MKPNNFPLKPSLDGSEELYTQTGGLSQKFTLEATKAFITEPTDITYSELYNKITNEELVAGSWYRLTDYKSVNFLNGTDIAQNNTTPTDPNFNPQEIYTGETEVLLLQATTESSISPIGYSETYPKDIIQYNPLANKIGLLLGINNGQTLPNSNIVSGLDLQWDGTNVYFNMPIGYPAIFGELIAIYAEFDGGIYDTQNFFYPLNRNINTPILSFGISTNIKVKNNGTKIILLDLTEQNYLDYDADTLYVQSVYALGDAYGNISRRIDTNNNIDVPFDFRGIKYRRFEVDLSTINPDLGTGYYGQGDNYLGQGTTGNYRDFKCFGEDSANIKINGYNLGSTVQQFDNNVFFSYVDGIEIGSNCKNNTIGADFNNNTVGNNFRYNTIEFNFQSNNIGNQFQSNTIGNSFQSNTIGNNFNSNTVENSFSDNTIGNFFQNNTIGFDLNNNTIGNDFYDNTIESSFRNNTIRNSFQSNTIGFDLNNNTIGNNFKFNTIGAFFELNTIGNEFYKNTIGNSIYNNTIGNSIYNNTIGNSFGNNTI